MDIKEFRSKYPEYDDMSDADLISKLHAKHYSDMDINDFSVKFNPYDQVVFGGDVPQAELDQRKADGEKATRRQAYDALPVEDQFLQDRYLPDDFRELINKPYKGESAYRERKRVEALRGLRKEEARPAKELYSLRLKKNLEELPDNHPLRIKHRELDRAKDAAVQEMVEAGLIDPPREYEGFWDELGRTFAGGSLKTVGALASTLGGLPEDIGIWDHQTLLDMADNLYATSESRAYSPADDVGVRGFIAQSIGQTLPYMAASTLATTVTGSPLAAFGVGFTVEGDAAYREAIEAGATEEHAQMNRLIVGALNGAIETLQVSDIIKFANRGKGTVKNILGAAKKKAWKELAGAGKDLVYGQVERVLRESLEEAMQEVVSISAQLTVVPEDFDAEEAMTRVGQAALGGAVGGFFLGAAGSAGQALMERSREGRVLKNTAAIHNVKGGSVIDGATGAPMVKGFPVGTGNTRTIKGKTIDPDDLSKFRAEFADELSLPNRQIGTRYDEETNTTYIDVVEIAQNEDAALDIAMKNNERYVYNLETGETIATPGVEFDAETGKATLNEALAKMPTLTENHQIGAEFGLTADQVDQRLAKADKTLRGLENMPEGKKTRKVRNKIRFLKKAKGNLKALLEEETKPSEIARMTRREALKEGHKIPRLLGWSDQQRKEFNKKVVGKESMKDMVPAQRERLIEALREEAREAGIDVAEKSSPVADMIRLTREKKQRKDLTARDRRNLGWLPKMLAATRKGGWFYFLNMSRMKRICLALDNYDPNGPFSTNIYRATKDADVKAALNYTKESEATRQAFEDAGLDVGKMMFEVKDMGIKDKLTTTERMGAYALSLNKAGMNKLRSMYSAEEAKKIVDSITDEEKLGTKIVMDYYEQGFPAFQMAARAMGIKKVVKQENYMTLLATNRNQVEETDFAQELAEEVMGKMEVPGRGMTKERKERARYEVELDLMVIHRKAAAKVERFKAMAPVVRDVGRMLNNKQLRSAVDDVTYGSGSKIMTKWLQDAVRGREAYDTSPFAPSLRWLRKGSTAYVLGYKILTVTKQGVSLLNAMATHPMMAPAMMKNLALASVLTSYKAMESDVHSKSPIAKTRSWDRDIRLTHTTKEIAKFYKGKSLSPKSMAMISWVDRHTVTVVWKSAYDVAKNQGMNEEESRRYADGVVEDTQPMGSAVDIPGFFRGGEIAKLITAFQNQVNQNGNFLWYNVLGERRVGRINNTMMAYRLLTSQVLPSLLLGLISRGRPPETTKEIATDIGSYVLSPYVFLGQFVLNTVSGRYGPSGSIADVPFTEAARLTAAVRSGDERKIARSTARTVGAWSGGRIPLQAIITAEGAWDLATGETNDFRRLIWSEYALKRRGKKEKKGRFAR